MSRLRAVPTGERVLVVGAGFIGVAVARAIAQRGQPVTILTRGTSAVQPPVGPFIRVVVGDASDESTLADALAGTRAVVYCAGGSLPAEAERDPAGELKRAMLPLLGVLEAVRHRAGIRVLFLSSGGTIYGEPDQIPVPEDHPLRPATAYATAKATAEQYLLIYREHHGVASTSLRCANAYGPGQVPFRSQGVIATLLASAATGREVVVYGDGSGVRDYIFVGDVADGIAALLDHDDLPAAVNLGTGVGTRLDHLLELVERTVNRRLAVRFEPRRSTDLQRVVLDVTRLRELVPFDPVPLPAGLRQTWGFETAADVDVR